MPCIQLIEFNEEIAARVAALKETFDIHELSVDEYGDLSCRSLILAVDKISLQKKDLILVPVHGDTLSLG